MIALENVGYAKQNKLDQLVSALEDQDKLLEGLIDQMPDCDEKTDLTEVKGMVIDLLGKVARRLESRTLGVDK